MTTPGPAELDQEEPSVGSGSALRKKLYALHDAYRPHTENPRIEKCGRVRHEPSVMVSKFGKRARLGGLIRCKSKACPVCLAHRRSEYAEQIMRTAEHWTKLHSSAAYLATFTIRHGMGDTLEKTGHGVRAAWRAFIGGRAWQKLRARFGFEYIIAEEVTHGANGWHPHMHVLFLPTRRLSTDEVLEVADVFYERWCGAVERQLGAKFVPSLEHGADFRPTGKNDYISKLGLELADPGTKRGKKGRTPIQLLDDWNENEDGEALALYQEYERVMKGRRDLTWSRGLKEERDSAKDELAEEAAAEREAAPLVAAMPGDIWDRWRHQPRAHMRLLEAAERGGLDNVARVVGEALGEYAAEEVRKCSARALQERGPPNDSARLEVTPKVTDLLTFGDDIPF